MANDRITDKSTMYRMLSAGEFGNTVPQFFTLESWLFSEHYDRHTHWGIRSGVAGGDKRMRLNVPTNQVAMIYSAWFPNGGGNISPMVDDHVTLRANIWESDIEPCGLMVAYPTQIDPASPWRGSFEKYSRHVRGVEAAMLLRRHLWPDDLDNLYDLLRRYSGAVIELSACRKAIGVVPLRNTVIWEVRHY